MSLLRRVRSSSRVTDALIQVCRDAWTGGDLVGPDIDEFIQAVRLHRIAPLAHVVTRELAPGISRCLQPDRDEAFRRNLGAAMVLGEFGRVLEGIPWVTFKGAALSMAAHPAPGLRTFMDIDALVAPTNLRSACEGLSGAGWQPLDFDDMLAARPLPGEMHWLSPLGLSVDLHWTMINRQARRNRFRIPTAELIDRRRELSLGLGQVPTLDVHDALIHVCVHAALDGSNRLLQLVDADGLARQVDDWGAVTSRALGWQAGAQLWLVLSRSRELLNTPLPDGLPESLGIPKGLRSVLTLVDRAAPIAATRSEHGLARLVARAVQPTLARTLLTVSRNAAKGVGDRLRPPPGIDHRVPAKQETLEAFLTAVEQSTPPDGIRPKI